MIGNVTFNLSSGGIATFRLDSILNMHTNGTGTLQFNVVGSTSEFDYPCVDEGAAQRVLKYIVGLQNAQAAGSFTIGPAVNYASPAATTAFLIYDQFANKWYTYLVGTALSQMTTVTFGGLSYAVDTANSSSTNLQTVSMGGAPAAFGTYSIQLADSFGNSTAVAATIIYNVQLVTCNPAPTATGTCTANGSSGLVGGSTPNMKVGVFPTLSSVNAYATTAVSAGTLTFSIGSALTSPVVLWYVPSSGLQSNYLIF